MVSKVFEKLLNNRIVDHLGKFGLCSDFQYGLRSSQSTADLLTADQSYRIQLLGLLTDLGLLELWHLIYPRLLHAGLLYKLKSYGVSGQIFGLICYFVSNRRL